MGDIDEETDVSEIVDESVNIGVELEGLVSRTILLTLWFTGSFLFAPLSQLILVLFSSLPMIEIYLHASSTSILSCCISLYIAESSVLILTVSSNIPE